jgi:hypothetical protein
LAQARLRLWCANSDALIGFLIYIHWLDFPRRSVVLFSISNRSASLTDFQDLISATVLKQPLQKPSWSRAQILMHGEAIIVCSAVLFMGTFDKVTGSQFS